MFRNFFFKEMVSFMRECGKHCRGQVTDENMVLVDSMMNTFGYKYALRM
jgi:hypothetical protein